MNTYKKPWIAYLAVGVMLWAIATASCAKPPEVSGTSLTTDLGLTAASEPSAIRLQEMLADISTGVGKVSAIKEIPGGRHVCVLEEKHTSVAGQIETALMLLRLHDRYGLRRIALEGLTTDKEFPSTKWFRDMGGPDDEELRNQIAVGLLRQGEISAVELIALVFPDVVVHAADDPSDYAVEMTKKAGIAGMAYLYKIGFKSVRPEHHTRIRQLQNNIGELIDYIISLDPWARERYERMKKPEAIGSIEQLLHDLKEIEDRAKAVGAQIGSEERSAMSDARNFFEAADRRTRTMVLTAQEMKKTAPLIALNLGAAHTEGAKRMLDESKTSYGVLTPLSLANNLKAGDIGYDAFERKNKLLSVAWNNKGLGSLIDGRRKPSPVVGELWAQSEAQMRFATALIARGAGGPNFPDENLRNKINALEYVKVRWETVRKMPNGDVVFMASVSGKKGQVNVWAKCGIPRAMEMFTNRKGPTLEQLLIHNLDAVRKETGERVEPKEQVVIETVTPDVMAAYAKEPEALVKIRISG